MHLLVTRPEPDAREMKSRLQAMGIDATIASLLSIKVIPPPKAAFETACGIIATSKNAVRALKNSDGLKDALALPLFAVGPGTAQAAREAGFKAIITGPQAGRELAALIKERTPAGRLLHVAGEILAFDLASDLQQAGLDVETVTAYQAQEVPNLSEDVSQELKHGGFQGVILMSPKTADVWCRVVAAPPLRDAAKSLIHLCLSEAVARKLAPLSPPRIAVSPRANGEEMLALAGRLAAKSN